jgi:hypothetical protein
MEPRTVILITVLGMVLATVVIGLLVLVKRPRTLLWALPLALVGAGAVVSVVAPVILRSNPAGPAASVATVTAPTSVVETSVQPRVPLAQAIAEGRVDVRVAGAGLETIDVTITSRNLTAFEVIIPVGT